jgi:polyhydroxyalkanoate synthesis repressor PhaR
MHVIKRYPNRKLYDTERKRYITLSGVAALIRRGVDIQVIDHETGEDLTTVTLSQIILEQERRRVGMLPQTILTSLIRSGGDTLDGLKRSFYTSVGAARLFEDEIIRRLDILVKRGGLAEDEARQLRRELSELRTKQDKEASKDADHGPLDGAMEKLNLPTRADVQRLSAQLEELTHKLDSFFDEAERASAQEPDD